MKATWQILLVIAASELTALALGVGNTISAGEARWSLAVVCLASGLLLLLGDEADKEGAWLVLYRPALLAGVSTLGVLVWHFPDPQSLVVAVRLALGVAVLVFTFSGATWFLASVGGNLQIASWIIVCIAAITAAAPVWCGPLVDIAQFSTWGTDFVIAVSPLSYLASLGGWDYLRGDWFYRHSPFGGLRYDYPSADISSLVYLTIGLAGHYLGRQVGRSAMAVTDKAEISDSSPYHYST